MAIYRRMLKRNVGRGTQRNPFTVHMNVTLETGQIDLIREMAGRNGWSAASVIRRLIDEALAARREKGADRPSRHSTRRGDDAALLSDFAPRRDANRALVEGSGAPRTRATSRRRDVL
ncbi:MULTISPECIES: hypothetical protein [Methylosinus]|uniref:hypothetical protein n=1 Tax=Methylosinus TaxID=425 RepID=UPI0001D2D6EE|nr:MULTISPECIES: hypothetical protein [Methylosinus]